MGQAKNRGTFEERKTQAIKKNAVVRRTIRNTCTKLDTGMGAGIVAMSALLYSMKRGLFSAPKRKYKKR